MTEKDTLYARWLSGKLNPEELEALEKSGALEELEGIIKITDQAKLPAYDLDAGLKTFKNKHQSKKPTAKIRPLSNRWPWAVAASLLLLLSFYFFNRSGMETYQAQAGANYEHRFDDGSIVQLNDASSIQFKGRKWSKERKVQLKGEAFFDVEPGPSFSVQTDMGTVEVLGTSFNVRAWGDQLIVACFSGVVKVEAQGQERTIRKNQAVAITINGLVKESNFEKEEPSWKIGESKFENEGVLEVFRELERQYGVKVESRPDLDQKFNGSFFHDDLEKALGDICKPLQLEYSIDIEQKIIRIE